VGGYGRDVGADIRSVVSSDFVRMKSQSPDLLEPVELQIFQLYMTRVMAAFDTLVEHYQLGTVSDERFQQHRSFTVKFLNSPGGQSWIASEQYSLSVAATDLIRSEPP